METQGRVAKIVLLPQADPPTRAPLQAGTNRVRERQCGLNTARLRLLARLRNRGLKADPPLATLPNRALRLRRGRSRARLLSRGLSRAPLLKHARNRGPRLKRVRLRNRGNRQGLSLN